jgi:hypothetical protein
MHRTAGVFLLRVLDVLVEVALQHMGRACSCSPWFPLLLAAQCVSDTPGRISCFPSTPLHRRVGCLLHRLDGEILDGMDHDGTLLADPHDNRWPVFVIVAPARLPFLVATSRLAPQVLFATL